MSKNEYLSVSEAAKMIGYSRQHVLRLIKSGQIKAKRIGRSFVVKKNDLPGLFSEISPIEKKEVVRSVDKIFKYYEDALKKLGKE